MTRSEQTPGAEPDRSSGARDAREGDTVGPAPGPRPVSLGRAVGSGMTLMTAATLAGRVASFLSQLVLAALLTPDEYGVAAIALAFGLFVQVFRDGGISRLLIQRGVRSFPRLAGPFFWLSLAFNTVISAAIFAGAPLIASVYGEPMVRDLLWVIALYPLLGTPGRIFGARLTIDLRFRETAAVKVSEELIRHGSVIIFALMGFGAMSFALPMPLVAIWRSVVTWLLVRDVSWMSRPKLRVWKPTLNKSIWVMVGTLATTLTNQGDYMVLGVLISTGALGVYFFAYQLSRQVVVMTVPSLTPVLLAALSGFRNDTERQLRAGLRAIRVLSLIATPMAFGLVCTIDPFVSLVLPHRWLEAVEPIQVLCLCLPLMVLNGVPRVVLQSIGKFRKWSMLVLLEGIGLVGAAAIGGVIAGRDLLPVFAGDERDAMGVAICVSLYSAIASFFFAWIGLKDVGARVRDVVRGFAPSMALGAAAMLAALGLDHALFSHWHDITRFALSGSAFAALYALLTRALLKGDLVALRSALPMRLQPLATASLRLPRGAGASGVRASRPA